MAISSSLLKRLVTKAVDTIGDLSSSVTYVQVVPGTYDPATDAVTTTETTHTNVKCALVKLSAEDVEWWPADVIGQKALIPYEALPITPTDQDYLLINGDRWSVYRIKQMPGNPLHYLYLRMP